MRGRLRGVIELSENGPAGTYRVYYTEKCPGIIHVLFCHMKKSKQGGKLPKHEEDLIVQRLKDAVSDFREKGGTLRVEEVTIPRDARVSDRTLGELEVDEVAGAMLLAVRHPETGEFTFKPPPDTPLTAGMTLVVMADPDGLDRLRKRFQRATGTQFTLEQTTE